MTHVTAWWHANRMTHQARDSQGFRRCMDQVPGLEIERMLSYSQY